MGAPSGSLETPAEPQVNLGALCPGSVGNPSSVLTSPPASMLVSVTRHLGARPALVPHTQVRALVAMVSGAGAEMWEGGNKA